MPSKDFTSNQIRVTKLIASGGLSGGGAQPGNKIGIAVYSASNASDTAGGISDNSMLDQVGKDVMFFVSGSTSPAGRGTDGGAITLIGGDLHVSGNLSVTGTGAGSSLLYYAEDSTTPGTPPNASGNKSVAIGDLAVASGQTSVVGGGIGNTASDISATVAGGQGNTASGIQSTVGGGLTNQATGIQSTVVGGGINQANGFASSVLGGLNSHAHFRGDVAGGYQNQVYGTYGVSLGGFTNRINENNDQLATGSVILGGLQNTIAKYSSASYTVAISGQENKISSNAATDGTANYVGIFSGYQHITHGSDYSVMLGGRSNEIIGSSSNGSRAVFNFMGPASSSAISGSSAGKGNYNAILAGASNFISSSLNSAILGGQLNVIGSGAGLYPASEKGVNYSLIGPANRCSITGSTGAEYAIILGGKDNRISAMSTSNNQHNYILGGENNVISGRSESNFIIGRNTSISSQTGSFSIGESNTLSAVISAPRIAIGWNIDDQNASAADKCHVVIGNGSSSESEPGASNPNTLITMSGSVKFTNTDHKGWVQSVPFLGSAVAGTKSVLSPYSGNGTFGFSPAMGSSTFEQIFVAPADGEIVEIIHWMVNGDGTNPVNYYLEKVSSGQAVLAGGSSSTLLNSAIYNPTYSAYQTQIISVNANSISKGDKIGIAVERTSTPTGALNITVKFRWNYDT